jgi:hypothetical protein
MELPFVMTTSASSKTIDGNNPSDLISNTGQLIPNIDSLING